MTRTSTRRLLATLIVAAWWLVQAPARAEDLVRPPQGWLAILHTSSLQKARSFASGLPPKVGGQLAVGFQLLDLALLGVDLQTLGDGPVAFGLVKAEDGEPFPFAMFSPPDFPALVDALGGERTGASAIVDRNGLAFTLAPFGEQVIVVLAENEQALNRLQHAAEPLASIGDLTVSFSRDGFAYLADRAETSSVAVRAASRRWLRLPWQWPPRLVKINAVFGLNTPLWKELAENYSKVHVSLGSGDDRELSATLRLERLQTRVATQRRSVFAARAKPADAKPTGILRLYGRSAALYLPDLLRLATAYQQGRPDEVRAKRFDRQAFADYEQKLQAVATLIDGADVRLLLPDHDDPVEANHALLLETNKAPALIDAIAAVAESWNELTKASKARDKLIFERRPFSSDSGLTGVALRADLVAAAGVRDTPDMRSLLDRYVGNNGWLTIHVAEVAENRVLLTDAPLASAMREVEAAEQQQVERPDGLAASEAVGTGVWRLDQHMAWLAVLDGVQNADTFGWKPTTPMAPAPPIAINLRADGERIEIELRAEAETIQELSAYLQTN